MIFPIGTKVKLKFTGEEATITHHLGDGIVNIRLTGDMDEFPVAEADLILPHQYKEAVPDNMPAISESVPRKRIFAETDEVQPLGIHLAFVPKYKSDDTIQEYAVYFVNCLPYSIIVACNLFLLQDEVESFTDKVDELCAVEMGTLLFDELNDHPEYTTSAQRISTEGLRDHFQKTVKLKPKNFFSALSYAPIIEEQAVLITLFEHLDQTKQAVAEDLKHYVATQVKQRKKQATKTSSVTFQQVPDTLDVAQFSREIDLHIENLTSNFTSLTNAEIIALQLQHFERYMAKAIQLSVDRVFIIHGLGKGRLRNEIARSLSHNTYVREFKNEFHPKYGWGATEVLF